MRHLFRNPLFWIISLLGNACIFGGAMLFHFLESEANPHVHDLLDSLIWAVGIVTTVGSNTTPITPGGKVLLLFMMMGGALFLWSYMALFIGFLIDPELRYIQHEVSEIQHEVRDLTTSR